jgi:MFS family permease
MKSRAYNRYLLALLMCILAVNYVDRWVLGLVQNDIKADLHLTDAELGFLSGIAFALFYAVMGIPIARWADRGNRATIISLCTAIWSAAVALCGVAGSFAQLLLVRIGVGVGEAGCIPPAHSLIADVFDRAERPRAVARYMLGISFGLALGYFAGGWLNQVFGWRKTFMMIGIPGLILAALAKFTIREPRRSKDSTTRAALVSETASSLPQQPAVKEMISTLWANSAFRHLLFCFSVWYFFGYGLLQWQPTFFIRSYGLQTGELGTWLAVVQGGGSALGVYLGGEWAYRYAANNERRQLIGVAVMFSIYAIFNILTYLAPNRYWAFAALTVAAIGGNGCQGPVLATMQTVVPAHMRAVSLALVYFFANLIGMGLGPLAAGALSDAFHPWAGDESVRYALVSLSPGYFWAAWHLWRAGRTVARDVAAAQGGVVSAA